jgi:prepilin-type N-terminal cleavage/methylation domain-containing protein
VKISRKLKRNINQKGFTLIELIIVLAVLAVLLTIIVPQFGKVLSDAREKANEANLQLLQNAVDLYIVNEEINADSVENFKDVIEKGYLTDDALSPPSGYPEYTVNDGIVGPQPEPEEEPEEEN